MNFSNPQEKESYVQSVFSRIASRYDFLNSLMSFRMDCSWRRRAAEKARLLPGDKALDCCCGTGSMSRELMSLVGTQGKVVGVDFCDEMLSLARRRNPGTQFVKCNTLDLPFSDNSFNASIMGFALRNVADPAKAIREMVRVVDAGGRIVVLELNRPSIPVFKQAFNLYFSRLVPFIGSLGSGHYDPYLYLARSYSMLPEPGEIMGIFQEAGMKDVHMEEMTGGVVALYWGEKK